MMEKILNILSDLHPDVDFTASHRLVDDGILDSLDVVTLLTELGAAFDIRIPVREILPDNFNSPEAILAMVERLDNA